MKMITEDAHTRKRKKRLMIKIQSAQAFVANFF